MHFIGVLKRLMHQEERASCRLDVLWKDGNLKEPTILIRHGNIKSMLYCNGNTSVPTQIKMLIWLKSTSQVLTHVLNKPRRSYEYICLKIVNLIYEEAYIGVLGTLTLSSRGWSNKLKMAYPVIPYVPVQARANILFLFFHQ